MIVLDFIRTIGKYCPVYIKCIGSQGNLTHIDATKTLTTTWCIVVEKTGYVLAKKGRVSTARPSDDSKHSNFEEWSIVLLRCFLKNEIEISLFPWRRCATKDLC